MYNEVDEELHKNEQFEKRTGIKTSSGRSILLNKRNGTNNFGGSVYSADPSEQHQIEPILFGIIQ